MEKISVNSIELAYERQGNGTPLVLLHGFPLDHHLWDEIVPLLKDSFDLIIPDLRGFGESETIDTPYTMKDYDNIHRDQDHTQRQTYWVSRNLDNGLAPRLLVVRLCRAAHTPSGYAAA